MVGNRPQFVKAAAVPRSARAAEEILVHTGQHYDRELSEIFFEELGLPPPDRQLGVGSGSHAAQTAAIMTRLEPLAEELSPDACSSTATPTRRWPGRLSAAKARIPLAHVEAGMRSFNRSMPEEMNRVLTDSRPSLLLCSTQAAVDNLAPRASGTARSWSAT